MGQGYRNDLKIISSQKFLFQHSKTTSKSQHGTKKTTL